MEYLRLGNSGLRVSRIALGCMSFGDTSRGFNEWALDAAAAEPIFRQALDLGITFWTPPTSTGSERRRRSWAGGQEVQPP
jgi:aryl-alcohol dehydrogenase-like predicted oxidoreductase